MQTETWIEAVEAARPVEQREGRAIRRALIVTLSLTLLAVAAWLSGAFTPGLAYAGTGGSDGDVALQGSARTATVFANVTNQGLFAERLVSFTTDLPGVTVTSARLEPAVIEPGASGRLIVEVVVACRNFTPDPAVVITSTISPREEISTSRPWGTVSTTLRRGAGYFSWVTESICTPASP